MDFEMRALSSTSLPNLTLVAKGKVRDIYSIPSDPSSLLFVATDRVFFSLFIPLIADFRIWCHSEQRTFLNRCEELTIQQGIAHKGKILTQLSKFWFSLLGDICPNHFITDSISEMPPEVQEYTPILKQRTMQVRKCSVIPVEAIVRGYITGRLSCEMKTETRIWLEGV